MLKKCLVPFLALALFLAVSNPCAWGATGLWDYAFIYSDTATMTFAWDAVSFTCPAGAVCGYEIELRQLENPSVIDKYVVAGLANTSVVAHYKKSGHYKLFIRTFQRVDQAFEYSDWGDSTTSGMVTIGVPAPTKMGWLLYWRLPPPGGGGVH